MADPTHTPTCPRCAYDVSGPISNWTDACPINGQCTECGLDFRWHDVIHPERNLVPWLFEHRQRFNRFLRTLISTAARSLWPVGFWGRLDMAHPIRLRRLALYLLLCWLAFHTTMSIGRAAPLISSVTHTWSAYQEGVKAFNYDLSNATTPLTTERGRWVEGGSFTGWIPEWNFSAVDAPTWARAGLGDSSFYLKGPIPEGVTLVDGYSVGWEEFGDRPDYEGDWVTTWTLSHDAPPSFFDTWAYETGISGGELTLRVLWPYTFDLIDPLRGDFLAPQVVVMLLVSAVMPFTFLCLGMTLSSAGIRTVHFARAFVYSTCGLALLHAAAAMGLIVTVFTLPLLSDALEEWVDDVFYYGDYEHPWGTANFFLACAWLFMFWWMFSRRYLRIPHAFWVALLLGIMSLLAVAAGSFVLYQIFE